MSTNKDESALPPSSPLREGPETIGIAAARILESITDAFFALDWEWRFTYLNSQAERLLAATHDEMLGKSVWDMFPDAVDGIYDREYRRALTEQTAVSFEAYSPPPLDTWFEVRAFPAAEGLSVYLHDITARKKAEEEIRASHARTEEIFESITDAFYSLDREFRFTYLNRRTEELWKWRREELLGQTMLDVFPHVAGSVSWEWHQRAMLERQAIHFEVVSAILNEWMDVSIYPTADGGLSVYFRDISERKALEAERERLLREAQGRAEREALMNRIGQAIRDAQNPDQVQAVAVQALGEALGVDRAYFTFYELADDRAWIGADQHRDDLPSFTNEYRLSDFQVNPADYYPDGKTFVVSDVNSLEWPTLIAEALRALRLRSGISVPLFEGRTLVGTLTVAMADAPRLWTPEEVALVETTAVQTRAAQAGARARQRERRIATELQDALQPKVPERVPGLQIAPFMRPALDEARIGGDFFDVFALDKSLYAVVIGDVSGKGLAAAAQLATVRNMLRSVLYQYRAPAEAVTSLNTILTAHNLLVGFVTAFVGIYDAGTGRLLYASCGHEPALVRRAAGGEIARLATTGLPLGVEENAAYTEGDVTLAAGDALLLYTDGLSEAGPNRRELLGTGGLSRLLAALPESLSVQESAERLVADVHAYATGIFRDDVCVLFVRRQ